MDLALLLLALFFLALPFFNFEMAFIVIQMDKYVHESFGGCPLPRNGVLFIFFATCSVRVGVEEDWKIISPMV
jgi:hypothetical protein